MEVVRSSSRVCHPASEFRRAICRGRALVMDRLSAKFRRENDTELQHFATISGE